ncbi:MAG: hypothetical protein A2836_03200 [Candidatus Taylorbacteria bacterium RIFCSPHIGHO2_01_FULL_45_63]|uniref:Small ribosomal subunit protein bS6 n=1 Tax=Candidatus Taylorbacteria bacterium RIFCSPHIGHO2_02_FULL_45_35 TaxID=1802311 RepID=A0A1G2MNA2_9BACT|nr:MAG: hypothetical protein A2836_03200 [Candidatus Taylorbacteria bacterium RIFCSPHIGHO2_01_FULL_45_63]OHA25385.1 MAG: hypothetical protein A3D56_01205 [Candidatus Taylorbacteria bacterium RIFCSPHIGHO2_02_FULL_45_35]OHA33572.1 MAG: hypothetical protein A3A22_03070 [Candidatus Taylorbacteria bacterium RIFCSPLOWO2_01_FULL_45_34b]
MEIQLKEDVILKIYEVGYLLLSPLSDEKLAEEVAFIKGQIQSSGVIVTEEVPRLRPLAYFVIKALAGQNKKYDNAYFGWIKFEMDAPAVLLLKEALEKRENVIRFLIIKTVRENTLLVPKLSYTPRTDTGKLVRKVAGVGEQKSGEIKTPISEEELDKTIAELVIE